MKASDLTERIYIYEQQTSRSITGAVTISYKLKHTCLARVNYSSGNRTIVNDEVFYDVDRQFIIRHYNDIGDSDEIRWNNQRWQILSIDKSREYNNIVINTTLVKE